MRHYYYVGTVAAWIGIYDWEMDDVLKDAPPEAQPYRDGHNRRFWLSSNFLALRKHRAKQVAEIVKDRLRARTVHCTSLIKRYDDATKLYMEKLDMLGGCLPAEVINVDYQMTPEQWG